MSLPQKMDALVLKGVRDFIIDTVPVPQPDADEVICKVDTTYICGTDPHIINGDFPGFWPTGFPFVPGHEWSGTVVQTGPKAASLGWKEGDRVCGISHCGCGYCEMCLKGRYNICLNYGPSNFYLTTILTYSKYVENLSSSDKVTPNIKEFH